MPLGWPELAIILVVVVIIFGVGKLPEIGGALGKGIKEFKTNVDEEADAKVVETKEVATKPTTPAKEEL
ncbi:MAG TPA: twin-arginine translocase TatA/TatE family subunit [Thermomicrobiales bacterium]|jgi:sec-independent protein translocase protein TatA|nr:twin-arginine translocase TatA/TatE family subunit [Chloroflexota bacterium]HBY45346.1 twin-arginine translocase TatA/TatE family subunit [Chloroflexota bacterium]HCG30718.1 twin-arginine translocase TatA/TatE family subunit [Chloroflexota bacterium]HQZ88815.1 twin-arginine translocase TatA/TatE family subunit [Thermomicrobiales bacterium]HRA32315.1 twin-arginine translocase TatA/TatE family subunit [Thermomicrobiales bacterium]